MTAKAKRALVLKLAREEHQHEGTCEIDDNAKFSEGEDNGTYVQAWVWVSYSGTPLDKEPEIHAAHTA